MGKWRSWWKKLNDRYRITVLDDENLEEVTSFQLTKKSLYIGLCTLVVVLVLFTGAVLSLTPLKYYIPGYGDISQRQEYIDLNIRADSLENLVNAQKSYLNSIKSVLTGKAISLDTTMLPVPAADLNKN